MEKKVLLYAVTEVSWLELGYQDYLSLRCETGEMGE